MVVEFILQQLVFAKYQIIPYFYRYHGMTGLTRKDFDKWRIYFVECYTI